MTGFGRERLKCSADARPNCLVFYGELADFSEANNCKDPHYR